GPAPPPAPGPARAGRHSHAVHGRHRRGTPHRRRSRHRPAHGRRGTDPRDALRRRRGGPRRDAHGRGRRPSARAPAPGVGVPDTTQRGADDEYLAAVLAVVRQIPVGRVMTYGLIAEVVAEGLVAAGGSARGGPRQVGTAVSGGGGDPPWWRAVPPDGRVPARHRVRALRPLRAEGPALTSDDDGARVRVRQAVWWPE